MYDYYAYHQQDITAVNHQIIFDVILTVHHR